MQFDSPPNYDEPEAMSPPHSIEAEQALIGGVLLSPDSLFTALEQVSSADFFTQRHRFIFASIERLSAAGTAIDAITVAEELSAADMLHEVGGLPYLIELANSVAGTSNIKSYASIVRERSTLRQLIVATAEISKVSYRPGELGAEDLLQMAERKVMEIAEGRPKAGGFIDANALLKSAVSTIDARFRAGEEIAGLTSGLKELDAKTSGWKPGELIIVAARPGAGKTALSLNFVEAALFTQEKPVLVFSLEMPADSLMMRMLSSVGKIDAGAIRSGKLAEDDWPKLELAARRLKDKPLFIDDTAGLTPNEIRARTRKLAREHGNPALIMIDYLQLMHVGGSKDGRTQEVSEISRSMKALAKEYQCPVICLSQLNRGVEARTNKRPMNSDLRESGAIEQDADVILFIYRDEYYNENSPDKGIAELIIGKQRNGETGTCRAAFQGRYTRFDNLSPEYMQQSNE